MLSKQYPLLIVFIPYRVRKTDRLAIPSSGRYSVYKSPSKSHHSDQESTYGDDDMADFVDDRDVILSPSKPRLV